jgi:hypothetical protein
MNINSPEELAKKINTLKDENKLDLSSGEDLSIAIMNLIATTLNVTISHKTVLIKCGVF